MITRKMTTAFTVAAISVAVLAGCTPMGKQEVRGDADPQAKAMFSQVVDAICALDNESIVTEEHLDNFRELSEDLKHYDGANKVQIRNAGTKVDQLVEMYEPIVGQDLGPKAANTHHEACILIQKQFVESYK